MESTRAFTTATNSTIGQLTSSSDKIKMKSCPIDNTFKIIGKRFTILILRNMINSKQTRFNQLLKSLEGIRSFAGEFVDIK